MSFRGCTKVLLVTEAFSAALRPPHDPGRLPTHPLSFSFTSDDPPSKIRHHGGKLVLSLREMGKHC